MRLLGVPYSEDEISHGARKALEGKTEMDALIAYLQGLGTAVKRAMRAMNMDINLIRALVTVAALVALPRHRGVGLRCRAARAKLDAEARRILEEADR